MQTSLVLGTFQRADGERFEISGVLHHTPSSHDHWVAVIDAKHQTWNHMAFSAFIPKRIASTDVEACHWVTAPIAEQVRSLLGAATEKGRNLSLVLSNDGWYLI